MSELLDKLAPQVRTMQIVVAAMVFVPLVFAGVVLAIGSQAPADPAPINGQMVEQRGGESMGRIALVVGLVALIAQHWMGRYVTNQAVANLRFQAMHSPERLGEAYLTGTVVACAICEGAAFLNLIAYMASQLDYNLWMGLLLVASNATRLPTVGRVVGWTEGTLQRLKDQGDHGPEENDQGPMTNDQ